MKQIWIVLSCLGAIGVSGLVAHLADATEGPPKDAIQRAEAIAEMQLSSGALHGGVGLALRECEPRTVFAGATATLNGVEVDGSTRFRLASLTKMLTRIAILKLVEAGRLSLDDTLAMHRPGLNAAWADDITIRQLLTFRSGLPRERSGVADPIDAGVTFDERGRALPFLDTLIEDGPTVAPGTRVLYSNLGYFHLGGVIESVTGESVEQAFDELIFSPIGMRRTTLGDDVGEDQSNVATGHHRAADGSVSAVEPFPIAPRYTAGGFVSTVDDLVALSRALLQEQLLSAESVALLVNEFGDDDDQTLRIAGLVPGFANVWSVSLDPPSAVIVLNNVVGPSPGDVVAAHDAIAAALRAKSEMSPRQTRNREKDGWRALRHPTDWPDHLLMDGARVYFQQCAVANADQLYDAGLVIRGETEDEIDDESRGIYRWMATYQAALRDRYGPFELAWWRHGEDESFEFLFEGPDGRALRYKLRPSDADPSVTSTLSIATVGFHADPSLYEGLSND